MIMQSHLLWEQRRIIINKKYIKEEVKDFSIFQNEKNAGKMTMLDDMSTVMTSALIILGYQQDSTESRGVTKGQRTYFVMKKNIAKFDFRIFWKRVCKMENISRFMDIQTMYIES